MGENLNNILWQARFEKKTNWLKARKTLLQAIKEVPEEKILYEELAELYSVKKLYKMAIEFYQKSFELDKSDENVIFKIANNFMSIGEYKLALFYYKQINSFIPEAMYNKAIALLKIDKRRECVQVLEDLIRSKPSSEYPYLFLVEQYINEREYDKAISTLSVVEKMFGKKGKVSFLKGLTYTYRNNWLNAYLEFKSAIKLNYNTANLYRLLGITCENINKTDEAVSFLLTSIRIEPFNANSYLDLIKIYLAHNRISEAYSIARHAKKIGPISPVISIIYSKIKTIIQEKKY